MASMHPPLLPIFAALAEQLNTTQKKLQQQIYADNVPTGTYLSFEEETQFGQPRDVASGMSGLRFFGGGVKLIGSSSPLMMIIVWD
jgi:hypothetical protein